MKEFLRIHVGKLVGVTMQNPGAEPIGGLTEATLVAVGDDCIVVKLKGRTDKVYVPFGMVKSVNELGDMKNFFPWPVGIFFRS